MNIWSAVVIGIGNKGDSGVGIIGCEGGVVVSDRTDSDHEPPSLVVVEGAVSGVDGDGDAITAPESTSAEPVRETR